MREMHSPSNPLLFNAIAGDIIYVKSILGIRNHRSQPFFLLKTDKALVPDYDVCHAFDTLECRVVTLHRWQIFDVICGQ